MADTFIPTRPPSLDGAPDETTFRVNRTPFGEGYSQRTPDGINTVQRSLTLNWDVLPFEEADAIVFFMEGKGGAESFWYTRPRSYEPERWICTRIARSAIDYMHDRLTLTLEKVYDFG